MACLSGEGHGKNVCVSKQQFNRALTVQLVRLLVCSHVTVSATVWLNTGYWVLSTEYCSPVTVSATVWLSTGLSTENWVLSTEHLWQWVPQCDWVPGHHSAGTRNFLHPSAPSHGSWNAVNLQGCWHKHKPHTKDDVQTVSLCSLYHCKLYHCVYCITV